ncbi:hypothetical protein BN1095_7740002 [Clostridioides difficile]|uniref:Uncharacterized protein n=1 Tax=Clostridioides difficile TaxID=1496 RepID=A0A069AZ79_CLODI|nr:hypothetical protein BN1095_7740002 [Clostridioides difficile]
MFHRHKYRTIRLRKTCCTSRNGKPASMPSARHPPVFQPLCACVGANDTLSAVPISARRLGKTFSASINPWKASCF